MADPGIRDELARLAKKKSTAPASRLEVACSLVDTEEITLADRMAMEDLLTRYATAIDSREWQLLDTVFTDDAHLDYRSAGGVEGSYPEVRRWLAEVLPIFDMTQHLVVNREFQSGTSMGYRPGRVFSTSIDWKLTESHGCSRRRPVSRSVRPPGRWLADSPQSRAHPLVGQSDAGVGRRPHLYPGCPITSGHLTDSR